MKTKPTETALDGISDVDPELALALAADVVDAEAEHYADRLGMVDLSTTIPF